MKTIATAILTSYVALVLYALLCNPWSALWLAILGVVIVWVVTAVSEVREDAAELAAEEREELARDARRVELEPVLGRKWWTKS